MVLGASEKTFDAPMRKYFERIACSAQKMQSLQKAIGAYSVHTISVLGYVCQIVKPDKEECKQIYSAIFGVVGAPRHALPLSLCFNLDSFGFVGHFRISWCMAKTSGIRAVHNSKLLKRIRQDWENARQQGEIRMVALRNRHDLHAAYSNRFGTPGLIAHWLELEGESQEVKNILVNDDRKSNVQSKIYNHLRVVTSSTEANLNMYVEKRNLSFDPKVCIVSRLGLWTSKIDGFQFAVNDGAVAKFLGTMKQFPPYVCASILKWFCGAWRSMRRHGYPAVCSFGCEAPTDRQRHLVRCPSFRFKMALFTKVDVNEHAKMVGLRFSNDSNIIKMCVFLHATHRATLASCNNISICFGGLFRERVRTVCRECACVRVIDMNVAYPERPGRPCRFWAPANNDLHE